MPAARPYDATLPVDLGGVDGVTTEQQAEAERLVTESLEVLPQFADWTTLEARGWHSIGDGVTGYEHFMNWPLIAACDTWSENRIQVEPAANSTRSWGTCRW